MKFKLAPCESSFLDCVAAIERCKGSLQYVGGKTKMDITRHPLNSEICFGDQETMA